MGLLTEGVPLQWSEVRKYCDIIRKRGINGFLKVYHKYKNCETNYLKWGDEIEFNLVKFDHVNKKVYLLLKSEQLLPILQEAQTSHDMILKTHWSPEFTSYMIEGTPAKPYGDELVEFTRVEGNMHLRRKQIQDLLDQDEYVFSLTAYPLLGCENFTYPSYTPTPGKGITKSMFFPDEIIFTQHPRYTTLARTIRERRGSKVVINIPVFLDKNTPRPFNDQLVVQDEESIKARKKNHIYLDSMSCGMGCSCLQMTFQAQSVDEARHLYDQLAPLAPIMLALSAASPIWKGYLTDIDCRWNVLSQAADDRTPEELGKRPLKENKYRIHKSRYDSIDSYISKQGENYNDLNMIINQEVYDELVKNDVDHSLAHHIAHLFIRDPVCVYKEKLIENDENEIDHFENIQSTNWQTMRFKIPPVDSDIGWRIEFRAMELQLSDFANAALVTFLVLLTRTILSFKLNFLIPISKVDENMQIAQKRDACRREKFYFRKKIFDSNGEIDNSQYKSKHKSTNIHQNDSLDVESDFRLMSINEIINGSEEFPGLIPLIEDYMANLIIDIDTEAKIREYLKFISARAEGTLLTGATFMRKFVQGHPKYANDSRVTDEIAYDLLWRIHLIATGEIKCPDMFFEKMPKDRLD